MKVGTWKTVAGGTVALGVWASSIALVNGQAAPAVPQAAEQVFKNVQVLRGISADDFIGTMGVFSAALGISCENCHGAATNWAGYAKDEGFALKQRTRQMVIMMQAINRANFGGKQGVTCMTCHRGSQIPMTTPSLDILYGPSPAPDDAEIITQATGAPTPNEVFDKYIQAVGGAQRVAGFTSYVAKGAALGYGPEGERPVEFYGKAPGQRQMVLHTGNGESYFVVDGKNGWEAGALGSVRVLENTGQILNGIKVEALLQFPSNIKTALVNPRVGYTRPLGDRDVIPVQGEAPGGGLINLFFDAQSGLLVRFLRMADSPVGRLSERWDYDDYRDVSGIKFPHKVIQWRMNTKEEFEFRDVQINVPVDAARFTKPAGSPKAGI